MVTGKTAENIKRFYVQPFSLTDNDQNAELHTHTFIYTLDFYLSVGENTALKISFLLSCPNEGESG